MNTRPELAIADVAAPINNQGANIGLFWYAEHTIAAAKMSKLDEIRVKLIECCYIARLLGCQIVILLDSYIISVLLHSC